VNFVGVVAHTRARKLRRCHPLLVIVIPGAPEIMV
jgi:hypothetical protein